MYKHEVLARIKAHNKEQRTRLTRKRKLERAHIKYDIQIAKLESKLEELRQIRTLIVNDKVTVSLDIGYYKIETLSTLLDKYAAWFHSKQIKAKNIK